MLRARRPSSIALLVVALSVGAPRGASADEKKPCEAGARAVVARTPVFGGPGLGFEVVSVVESDACMRILSTTDDGTFQLVELAENKAGWVTTGTVDSALTSVVETAIATDGAFLTVRELVLRETPRFDALVVGAALPAGAKVTRRQTTADGQWYQVATDAKEPVVGWVPKYQVAQALPESGAKAAATSTEGWGAARLGRTTLAARPTTTTAPADPASDSAKPDDTKPNPSDATPKEGVAQPEEAKSSPTSVPSPSTTDVLPAPTTPAEFLGRTQELSIGVGYRYWLQSYTSDAQQDPFFKYEVSTPAGFGLTLDYGWRGDLPLVVDVRASLGVSLYRHLHTDGVLYTAIGTQTSLWPRVAWRLHENGLVDVDAGISFGGDGLWNYSILLESPTSSTITGFYLGAGPSIAARSRLSGGEWGLLIMEASIPVGGYTMFPDPGATYTEYASGKAGVQGDPGLVYAELRPQNTEDPPVDDVAPGTAYTDGAIPLHLMVGADGRVRYVYAFTPLLRVEVGGAFTVRQAFIAGPGRRNGSYSEAANIDMAVTGFAGVNFGL